MRLKDYGRNRKERKEYIHQSGLLISEVDDSKAKNNACIRLLEGVRYRNAWVLASPSAFTSICLIKIQSEKTRNPIISNYKCTSLKPLR